MEELIRMIRRLDAEGVAILKRYTENLINLGYAAQETPKEHRAHMAVLELESLPQPCPHCNGQCH